jgi:ABC-type amino acid transport substrate-binding protein
MRTRTFLSVMTLVLLLWSCGGSEEEARFNENTPMYEIQQDGVLRVAVPDTPPFGSADASEGFSVDVGRRIAEDLEVEAEFVIADSEEMGQLAAYEIVDLGFPLTPLTFDALRVDAVETGYAFATPYFVGHQRLLVTEGSGAEQPADLEGESVCSFIDQDTQVDLADLVNAEVQQASSPQECAAALKKGRVDAVTASDAVLVALEIDLEDSGKTSYEIVGDELNTEGYAAVTLPGSMATYVIGELNDVEEEGLWLDLYNEWFEPYLGPVEEPPQLTLQDAASLYPPEPTPSSSPGTPSPTGP